MEREIVVTLDGSHTLYVSELDEHYHSTRGAIAESSHVFIDAGFRFCRNESPTVFEAGFGTGLNALLTAMASRQMNRQTSYITLEKYPIESADFTKLNYPELAGEAAGDLFRSLHEAPWNRSVQIDQSFSIHKIKGDLQERLPECAADLVYYDAFAPSKQPELWSRRIIAGVVSLLKPGGIFVTYSARGELKRTLRAEGMETELLPGAAGKRHMLRAVKI